jgi:hypothetical protein
MYDQAAKKQTVLYFPNVQLGTKEEEMKNTTQTLFPA